jgi:hypothetical protein
MPTRRSFLTLLAAAPVIAPVAARSMAAPRYAVGGWISGEAFLHPLVGEACSSETLLTQEQFRAFSAALDKPSQPHSGLRALMRSASPWDVPNRLHGAYINDDGDAV